MIQCLEIKNANLNNLQIFISDMKKTKKHQEIIRDYESQKAKHLEKIASKILNNDEKFSKLKEKETSLKFLKLF